MTAEQRPHEPAVARGHAEQRPPPGRGGEPVERPSRPGRSAVWPAATTPPPAQREPRRRGVAASRAQAWRLPRARRRGRRTLDGSATPSRSHSAAQCASSSRRRVAQPVVDVQRAHGRRRPRAARATSSRQTESRPPESSTSTGAPGASSPPARTRRSRSMHCDARPPAKKAAGLADVAPPPAGNAARCLGRRRSCGRRLAGGRDAPTSRPVALVVRWLATATPRRVNAGARAIRPARCGYSLSSIAR